MRLPKMNEILIDVADKKDMLFKINDPDMDILQRTKGPVAHVLQYKCSKHLLPTFVIFTLMENSAFTS